MYQFFLKKVLKTKCSTRMSRRRSILISDVIYTASVPIIYVGRIWGLFPFVISKEGAKMKLRWSKKFAIYSFLLGAALVVFTIKGMINDLQAGSTKSVRMKQETGKYVTAGDISIVALIVFVGIFGLPFNMKDLFCYIECINEVDSFITVSDAQQARKTSILRLCMILSLLSIILCSDIVMWWTIGDHSKESDFLIGNYVPFYISYYIVLLLECQYWHVIHCIQRRLKLINDCLRIDLFTSEEIIKNVENKPFSMFKAPAVSTTGTTILVSPKSMGSIIDALGKHKKITDFFFAKNANKIRGFSTNDCVVKLTRAYLKLCDAADCINKFCGVPVLIILTSCLLHLIVTPYFLVLEVTSRRNPLFVTLQSLWLVAHIGRLIIIVEACHACRLEAKNIRPLICKLLCFDFDDNFKRQLELFAVELHHRQIEYTACGLVKIDRTLITSIAGAVTTYLVILIQFQKSDSNEK